MTRILALCAAASALLLQPAALMAAGAKPRPAARKAAPAATAAPHITFNVVSEGKGANPKSDDVVLVAYIGRLKDGTIFDTNNNAALPVDGVVEGFGQALRRMKVGGSYHVTIPSALGYGKEPKGPIPANSMLIFDVMLFDFKTSAELEAINKRMDAEQAAAAAAPAQPPAPPKP